MRFGLTGCALLAATWILPACERGFPGASHVDDAGRGVLLLCIDSLRADHVRSLGYDRDTTPALDRLAAEGVSFSQFFSTAPWVLPAHVTALTGCDPYVALRYLPENIHPSMVTLWNLPRDAPRLAKEFLRHGYATAAFADHPWVSPAHGMEAGFQDFFECRLEDGMSNSDVGVEMLALHLENWLLEQSADRNWFAYVHLHDLERTWRDGDPRWDTYFTPRPELGRVPPIGAPDHTFHSIPRRRWRGGLETLGQYEAQYDGAIRRLDERLDRLFSRMAQIDRWDRTTVAVVGTYGVGFGEGGVYLDHGLLADVDLHVPWILRPSADVRCEQGLVTPALASLLDVAPTLLELHGLAVPGEMQGVSQAPVLRGLVSSVREHAVARCGFQSGFVVMDARYCYERTMPWSVRDSELGVSWYGHVPVRDGEVREVFHDRDLDPALGHVHSSGEPDPERIEILRLIGEDWLTTTDDLRQRVQRVTWPEPLEPSWMGGRLSTGGSPGSPP